MVTQPRNKNPNWKGGRTTTGDGYVLVKVGVDHHLADVRGYAYAHRVEAETILGRRLAKGERVLFRNGDRQDCSYENLIIKPKREAEEIRADKIRRATLRKRGVAPVPPDARDDLLSMFDGLCAYCDEPATVIDHVIPVVAGGKTEPGNVLPACSTCNGSKHSRDIYEWLDATGRVPRVETLEWLAHHQILEAA